MSERCRGPLFKSKLQVFWHSFTHCCLIFWDKKLANIVLSHWYIFPVRQQLFILGKESLVGIYKMFFACFYKWENCYAPKLSLQAFSVEFHQLYIRMVFAKVGILLNYTQFRWKHTEQIKTCQILWKWFWSNVKMHWCTSFCSRYQQMMQTLKNTMIMVVESLINKFEEDQMRKEEMVREKQHSQSNSQYADNCSDSDSSFNQVRGTVHTLWW